MQKSSFRWPVSGRSSPKNPYLQHAVSMVNLAEPEYQPWHYPRSPPSPSASSISSAGRTATPTIASSNPWSSASSSPTSPSTDKELPGTTSSTPRSRTPTQIANPRPLRPSDGKPNFTSSPPMSPPIDRNVTGFDLPQSATTSSHREGRSPPVLPSLADEILTPRLAQKYKQEEIAKKYPGLFSRQKWDLQAKGRAHSWALQNPRSAYLWMYCADLDAFKRSAFFGLKDDMLPYSMSDLEGIVANPAKALANQWRVMVREFPRNGQHIELSAQEGAPFRHLRTLTNATYDARTTEVVQWIGEHTPRDYIRRTYRCADRSILIGQLHSFKRLSHKNIEKITCSYAQGNSISIITPYCGSNLEDFLAQRPDSTKRRLLLGWINDLLQGLSHIHAEKKTHGSITPRNILIEGSSVCYSVFAIENQTQHEPDGRSSGNNIRQLYAAPEVATRGKAARLSDVFSLGCVFLDMLTVIQGRTVHDFAMYRASSGRGSSFQANLSHVRRWMSTIKGPEGSAENKALDFTEYMLNPDPTKRAKMSRLVPHVEQWNESRMRQRRRSFDSMETGPARWGELASLNDYYSSSND